MNIPEYRAAVSDLSETFAKRVNEAADDYHREMQRLNSLLFEQQDELKTARRRDDDR